ncbi:hypothetical protein AB0J55_44920 [Amycolatopsis sp. NPDC049688]|uniref:hypothetical protein n=1 Tax=Amycolatopsis sp. NPDC049688 TaxID=3154733 RepID=UPI00342DF48A
MSLEDALRRVEQAVETSLTREQAQSDFLRQRTAAAIEKWAALMAELVRTCEAYGRRQYRVFRGTRRKSMLTPSFRFTEADAGWCIGGLLLRPSGALFLRPQHLHTIADRAVPGKIPTAEHLKALRKVGVQVGERVLLTGEITPVGTLELTELGPTSQSCNAELHGQVSWHNGAYRLSQDGTIMVKRGQYDDVHFVPFVDSLAEAMAANLPH